MDNKAARWYGVITLFIIVAISYVDRINLSVLITDPHFLAHIGLQRGDRASQGLLATAFMVGYGLSAFLFTPFCAALFGVRRSLVAGLVLWGTVTMISPWFSHYGTLLASRVLLGVSEGPLFSLASAYIKAHFESRENGTPNSFVNMGTGLGLALGYPLVGFLIQTYDWQASFHLLGLINLLLGIPLVLAFVHMPAAAVQARLRPHSPADALAKVGTMFRAALHTRHLLLITILTSAALAYLWGSSNWLPAYLKEARGFSLREMGWLASLPQYATVLAVLGGGLLIDRIERRHVPLIFLAASAGVAASVFLAINAVDGHLAAYCLIAANFFWGLQSPAIPSTVQYFARPEHVASAFGVVNGTGSLVAGLMPALMGAVIGSAGPSGSGAGFYAGFALLIGTQAVVFLCGAALLVKERAAPCPLASGA